MIALDPDAFANGVNQGSALAGNIRKQRAALSAGDAFSHGDYSGAAAALGGSGDIGGAMQVQQYGAQQAAQQKAQADQQRQEGLTAMLHMAQGLRRIPQEQRPDAYKRVIAPLLQQQGVDGAHIDAMSKSPMDDQTLDATIQQLGGEAQKLQEVTPGASLYDPAAGKVVYSAPEQAKWQVVPEGGQLVNTSAMGAGAPPAAGPGGAAGAIPAQTPQANAAPVRVNLPQIGQHDVVQALQVAMAEDSKNPAGILSTIVNRAAATGKSIGDVLREPGQFETVSNGRASQVAPQRAAALLSDPTIAGIFTGQIPGQYANVTQFYAPKAQASLGRKAPAWDDGTGFDVGDTRFFARPTGGGAAPAGQGAMPNLPAPQFAAGGNPNVITGRPKAMTRPATADEKKAYGIDPATPAQIKPDGSIDVINGATPMTNNEVMANGATGDALLKALDPATAAQVKAYADGRAQFPAGAALRAPYFQHMLQLVGQYDPAFDQVNFGSRFATRKAFTSGVYSQNITSFNTALKHADALDKTVDAMNNGPFTWFNGVKNLAWASNNADSSALMAQFDANKTALVDELPRVFRGTGGTAEDVKHWEQQINSSKSPQALHATMRALAGLIESRIQSLSDTYTTGMGKASDAHEFLSPKANEVLQRMGVTDASSFGGGRPAPAPAAAPGAVANVPRRTAGGATVSAW